MKRSDPNRGMHLRRAEMADRETLFVWRNDDWLVSLSASRRKVGWDEHCKWFEKALKGEQCLLFVIESQENEQMGSLRFDKKDGVSADVSISVLRQYTGAGLGVRALVEGCRQALAWWSSLALFHARIRRENAPSRKAFLKAGFFVTDSMHDPDSIFMELTREMFAHRFP